MQKSKTKNIDEIKAQSAKRKAQNHNAKLKIFIISLFGIVLFFVGFQCDKKNNSKQAESIIIQTLTPSAEILKKESPQNNNQEITAVPTPEATAQVKQKEIKSASTPKPQEQKINIELAIDYNPQQITFPLNVAKDSTVYDLLQEAQKQGKISFRAKNYSFGVFIEEINGIVNSAKDKKYWMFYVNDKLSEVGASLKKLNNGDRVLWKYEKVG